MDRIKGHAGLLVFVVGLLVIAGAAGLALGRSSLRMTGYNDAPVQIDVATVPAGARACQPGGAPWDGTRAVRLSGRVDGPAPGTARAEREVDGAPPAVGPWTALRPGNALVLPVPPPHSAAEAEERLCVSNRGPAPLVLSGVAVGPEAGVAVADRAGAGDETPGAGRFRVEGLVGDRPSGQWGVADRMPERIAAGTGVAAAPWLGGGGLIVAIFCTAALLLRRDEVRDAG